MAQYLHVGLYLEAPFANLPFGICAIYFDLKVNKCLFQVRSWHILTTVDDPEFKEKKLLRAKGVGRNVGQWWVSPRFLPREPRLEVSPTSNRTQQKCPKIASKKENVHLPTINFQPAFCWLVWRARANLEVTKVCPASTCVGFCWCGFGFTPNPRCWCSSTKMTVHFCAVDHNLELPASCLEDHLRTHFSG